MSIVALRVFIYSVLPVLAATIHIALDKRAEAASGSSRSSCYISSSPVSQVAGSVASSATSLSRTW